MPVNEVGDRVHNFFEQENLSQGQPHPQDIDGNFLTNNLWGGNQGQVSASLSSNLKNYNFQQSDSEKIHGSQSLRVSNGLNYTQLSARLDFSKNQYQNQQSNFNGYMHAHHATSQTLQNEGNFLGVELESEQNYLASRVHPNLESQHGNDSEHNTKNSKSDDSESPVNFDFLGGQQHINGQQFGMAQIHRKQSGFSDMQILQQETIFKQMQDFQRQQLQPLESRQHSLLDQTSSIGKQGIGNLLNGTPVHSACNYPWSTEPTEGNSNWCRQIASPAMQDSSHGPMFSSAQGQPMRSMGLTQPVNQFLYGTPISNTRSNLNQYPNFHVDKHGIQQMLGRNSSFLDNHFTVLQNQFNMQDQNMVSRQSFLGRHPYEPASVESLNSGLILGNPLQMNAQQNSAAIQEFHGKQRLANFSEISQQKFVQVAPSQSVPTLDPTEEKILFGTNDNMWDAFGSTDNILDSSQSGTWSALMQSAVAETASDMGLREEWSDLRFQNSKSSENNPITKSESGKNTVWSESILQTSLGSGSLPDNSNTNNTDHGHVPGGSRHQQSEPVLSQPHGEILQGSSSHRSVLKPSENSGKWLDGSPLLKTLVEANQSHSNSIQASDEDLNVKNMSGPWTHQQNKSVYSLGSQPPNNPYGWKFSDSVSLHPDPLLKVQDYMKLHNSQNTIHKSALREDIGRRGSAWRADCIPNATVHLENVHTNKEYFGHNIVPSTSMPDPRTSKGIQETRQHLPNNYQLENQMLVKSSIKSKGSEDMRKYHVLNKSPQVLDSSIDEGRNGIREIEDILNKNENSSDSFLSAGMRENNCADVIDSHYVLSGKQNSSGYGFQKTPNSQKFQYHPMGNLDMDARPYGSKNVAYSPAMPQVSRGLKTSEQGHFGQPQFIDNFSKNYMEKDKGQLSESQGDKKELDDVLFNGVPKGCVPSKYPPIDRSANKHGPNKPAHSSDMLDLIHKVDQSRESNNSAHLSNQSSEIPEAETSDGSGSQLQRTHSASHSFGLQLAPPSQRLPIPNHSRPVSPASAQCLPLDDESHSKPKNSKSDIPGCMQGNYAPAITSHFQPQNQHTIGGNEQVKVNESANTPFNVYDSHLKQMDGSCSRVLSGQPTTSESLPELIGSTITYDNFFTTTEPCQLSKTNQAHVKSSSQRNPVASTILPTTWTNASVQLVSGTQSNPFNLNFQSSNISEMMLTRHKLDKQDANTGCSPDPVTFSVNSEGTVHEEEQQIKQSPRKIVSCEDNNMSHITMGSSQGIGSVKRLPDASTSFATTKREIEAFGRTLTPNNFGQQNNSLLHQVHAMKGMENDPSDRGLKRFKGPEGPVSGPESNCVAHTRGEQLLCGYDSGIRYESINCPSVAPGELKIQKVSTELRDNQDIISSQHSLRTLDSAVHVQIRPQMASSWFDQYGTFRNRQVQHDTSKSDDLNAMEQKIIGLKSSDAALTQNPIEHVSAVSDNNLTTTIRHNSTPVSAGSELSSSSLSSAPDVMGQNLFISRPNKRKCSTFEFIPMHKEVMVFSQRLRDISMTDIDWSQVANRQMETADDGVEMVEYWSSTLRLKRRLILGTQLMQHLFRPPLASILSVNSSSNYECMVYVGARLALGDACSLTSSSLNSFPSSLSGGNTISNKTSKSIGDRNFSTVVEELADRSRKLGKKLLGLEKRASIADLKLECHDIEKFCTITRFARFHTRPGQTTDKSEASSSSVNAIPSTQQNRLQRYVTAAPMPVNLPERVQCLSL